MIREYWIRIEIVVNEWGVRDYSSFVAFAHSPQEARSKCMKVYNRRYGRDNFKIVSCRVNDEMVDTFASIGWD